jgi:plasmid stabilization system protein ParE
MNIKLADSFVSRLNEQVNYIAKDKPGAARKFKNDVLSLIRKLQSNALLHRKSIYFEDPTIRELIFKGYKIVYKISDNKETIVVFGLIKEEEKL